jgi:hypothetical protein
MTFSGAMGYILRNKRLMTRGWVGGKKDLGGVGAGGE